MSKLALSAWVQVIAWGSAAVGAGLSLYVWGYLLGWQFGTLTAHTWFPLFGLLAYSLMVSHYLASLVRQLNHQPASLLANYFKLTSRIVLICILLHPGLITYALWSEGHGLPPGSYKYHVGANLMIWVYVGIVSWLAFLLYELHTWFEDRSWWQYVGYASDAAMIGIFFHALNLGEHLAIPWFRWVWYGYGVILAACLGYKYWRLLKQSTVSASSQHS